MCCTPKSVLGFPPTAVGCAILSCTPEVIHAIRIHDDLGRHQEMFPLMMSCSIARVVGRLLLIDKCITGGQGCNLPAATSETLRVQWSSIGTNSADYAYLCLLQGRKAGY